MRLFVAGAVMLILMLAVHAISRFRKPLIRNEAISGPDDQLQIYGQGSVRTMSDFLRGFSVWFGLSTLGLAGLDWAVSRERAQLLKRVALCNIVWLAAMTAISWHYFFAVPAVFLTVTLVIFVLAWIKLPGVEAS